MAASVSSERHPLNEELFLRAVKRLKERSDEVAVCYGREPAVIGVSPDRYEVAFYFDGKKRTAGSEWIRAIMKQVETPIGY